MKVTLVTTKYPSLSEGKWLTNELAHEFARHQTDVTVIALSWLDSDPQSRIEKIGCIKVVRVKLPSIFYSKNKLATFFKIILFPLVASVFALINISACQLAIFNTPCITIGILPLLFKLFYKAKLVLVAWDFFPFYLRDLGAMKGRISFSILQALEKSIYFSFDKIGCMTRANISFLVDNYSSLLGEKAFILPVWTCLDAKPPQIDDDKASLVLYKYDIPENKKLAVYGGALTFVQRLENLLDVACIAQRESNDMHFVIIGRGEAYGRLVEYCKLKRIQNVTFIPHLPRDEYFELIQACDVGLVFLSSMLSVPSFPSKTLDYLRAGLPILAAVDSTTDYARIIQDEAKAGLSCNSSNHYEIYSRLSSIYADGSLADSMALNGRSYLHSRHDVSVARRLILEACSLNES
jgi:glycosyltransferase involved in cell wall biosynthesis